MSQPGSRVAVVSCFELTRVRLCQSEARRQRRFDVIQEAD